MHSLFSGVLTEQVFAPRPPGGFDRAPGDPELDRWTAETTRLFEQHAADLAAVVVEPVLQGAGGMHVYSPACLRLLRRLCDEHGVLLVARRDRHRVRTHRARCSPPSTPAWSRTCCAWARR
jgi:adenosylmethionine-8-amino-7-oxononanoate aminotransferase